MSCGEVVLGEETMCEDLEDDLERLLPIGVEGVEVVSYENEGQGFFDLFMCPCACLCECADVFPLLDKSVFLVLNFLGVLDAVEHVAVVKQPVALSCCCNLLSCWFFWAFQGAGDDGLYVKYMFDVIVDLFDVFINLGDVRFMPLHAGLL